MVGKWLILPVLVLVLDCLRLVWMESSVRLMLVLLRILSLLVLLEVDWHCLLLIPLLLELVIKTQF